MSSTHSGPYRVGLTASLAAGKSTALSHAVKRGFPTLNTDALTHEILNGPNPAYEQVLKRFGSHLAEPPGAPIDRTKLARIVFSDAQARRELEQILHPAVNELLRARTSNLPAGSIVIVEVPLLFEARLEKEYDETLVLTVNEDVQMERLLARPNMDKTQAQRRINAQLPQREKALRADYIIDNSGSLEAFEKSLDQYFEGLRKRAAKELSPSTSEKEEKSGDKPSDNAPPDDATPGTDPQSPAAADSEKAPPVDPEQVKKQNERLRAMLKDFVPLSGEMALDKMGEIGTTKHKEASAKVRVNVDTQDCDESGTKCQEHTHEVGVDVHMWVKQKHTTGNASGDSGCSCGCGATCRRGCACASGCGCSCPAPTPPPTPPTPPTPTPPAPRQPWWRCWHRSTLGTVAIVALVVALLAFLAFLYAPRQGPHNGLDKPTVLTNPTVTPLPAPPAATAVSAPCSPCGGAATPVMRRPLVLPSSELCAPGDKVERLTDVPSFAFSFTPNWVRARVSSWTVNYQDHCSTATVVGFDKDGKMVSQAEYRKGLNFISRLDVRAEASRVQVDRFESLNTFAGRTVYNYDTTGRLIEIQQFDGQQRLLTDATANGTGAAQTITIRRYDAETGSFIGSQSYDGDAGRTTLSANFYLFDRFSK